jgi:hypothetical protein
VGNECGNLMLVPFAGLPEDVIDIVPGEEDKSKRPLPDFSLDCRNRIFVFEERGVVAS